MAEESTDDQAPNQESKLEDIVIKMPVHRQLILSGLSRIITTTLLLPLDVISVRLMFPDAQFVNMFRQMVDCKGCGGPYVALTAAVLLRKSFSSMKWGHYYCRYLAHKKSCSAKGLNTLSNNLYMLTRRPIVMNVAQIGAYTQLGSYQSELKKAKEHTLLATIMAKGLRSHVYAVVAAGLTSAVQKWPFDAMTTSIIATTMLHPLDVMKVRLQLYPEFWGVSLFTNMMRCEGFRAPYTGLSAGILRQTTYTTSRLGTYYCLYEHLKSSYGKPPTFSEKIVIGVYAGLVGALIGCPSEVILIRMMADGPVDPYRRYRGLFHAFSQIRLQEGICTLWRGALLTMSRSVVISVAQIGTYAQARNYLVEKKRAKGFLLHLYTSMVSSLVTAIATLPLDTFKTRYQVVSQASHVEVYNKFRQETGLLGFWRGFTPYYVRLTVHTLITFYLLELLYDVHESHKKNAIKIKN